MLNFVEINVFGLPITIGKSLSNNGIKVKDVSDSAEEWPWPVMQRPLKQGTSVAYDRYSGVYLNGVKLSENDVSDGCHGLKLVSHSSKHEIDTTINVSREEFSSKVDPNKIRRIILHSNGTTDIQYISSGNVNPGSFGVASGSWSTVLSSECLEVSESITSVDVSELF
ncbi:hypothetical protein FOB64_003097 [Candida albicans]|uniref:Uncharacterized protein n=1 Tax=Candida albicans TaxID=5476 RepID=A0A8H6F3P1_CANAX|nr:hypothetical protein FOB64_003097 [Candida albicans]